MQFYSAAANTFFAKNKKGDTLDTTRAERSKNGRLDRNASQERLDEGNDDDGISN